VVRVSLVEWLVGCWVVEMFGIASALRLPHNYYDQNSSLYREAMTHRQQFYPQPFYLLYATMNDMQTRWELQPSTLLDRLEGRTDAREGGVVCSVLGLAG
jgi:hypothetical protein